MRRRSLLAAPSLAVLLCACARGKAEGLPSTPCVLPGVPREARCSWLEVPENPDAPAGRTLRLHLAVVGATGIRPLPDPIFVLAGGPGQAASEIAGSVLPLFASLEPRRDLVFVDQRGTGRSAPLACPDDLHRRPLAEAFDDEANAARLTACRDAFTDAGVDLAQYATWIAMRDLEAARLALGYGPVNLWGGSYGTRAALEFARQFPNSVRTVVLDGVAPAQQPLPVALAFDTDSVLDQVLAQTDGGLAEALDVILAPDAGVATVTDPFFGGEVRLRLERKQRIGLLRGPLYAPMLSAALPEAISRAGAGDWSALVGLQAGLRGGRLYAGMHFSVLCAEDVPRISDDDRRAVASTRAGTTFIDEYERACRGWPTRPVPQAFFAPPTFSAPTLLLSGGRDPATPPRNAEAVARTLPGALHVVAPRLGHGVSSAACAPRLVRDLVTRGAVAGLDGGCLGDLPAPTFFEAPRP
ncbi:MAG: alpha/beta fold hydrolase [Myxococcaceae bacterium]|nr:alpha/beta fold hydrolase [Myxococcaceae bacterium]